MWVILDPSVIFPFFLVLGVGYGVRFRSSDIKRGNKDKGAQQVCIRDLIGFGLSAPSALPDCQTWALCVLLRGRFALLEVAGEVARHPHGFGCVGCLRICSHQIYLLGSVHVCVLGSGACVCGLLWCHTHVVGLCLCFSAKCLCLGVCLCAGPRAQYHSHSLWSLRGSLPPALPPVSALFGAPGLQ